MSGKPRNMIETLIFWKDQTNKNCIMFRKKKIVGWIKTFNTISTFYGL